MKTKFSAILGLILILFASPVALAQGSFEHCAEVKWITTYDAYGYVHNYPVCTRVLRQYAHMYPQYHVVHDHSSGRTEAFIMGAATAIILDRAFRDNRRHRVYHHYDTRNRPHRNTRRHHRHGQACDEYTDRHGRLICR
jgi:hypothetical protein